MFGEGVVVGDLLGEEGEHFGEGLFVAAAGDGDGFPCGEDLGAGGTFFKEGEALFDGGPDAHVEDLNEGWGICAEGGIEQGGGLIVEAAGGGGEGEVERVEAPRPGRDAVGADASDEAEVRGMPIGVVSGFEIEQVGVEDFGEIGVFDAPNFGGVEAGEEQVGGGDAGFAFGVGEDPCEACVGGGGGGVDADELEVGDIERGESAQTIEGGQVFLAVLGAVVGVLFDDGFEEAEGFVGHGGGGGGGESGLGGWGGGGEGGGEREDGEEGEEGQGGETGTEVRGHGCSICGLG